MAKRKAVFDFAGEFLYFLMKIGSLKLRSERVNRDSYLGN